MIIEQGADRVAGRLLLSLLCLGKPVMITEYGADTVTGNQGQGQLMVKGSSNRMLP